jgi:hypothetical protein
MRRVAKLVGDGWLGCMVARLLATAALWFESISQKYKMGVISRGWPTHFSPSKKYTKKDFEQDQNYALRRTYVVFLCSFSWRRRPPGDQWPEACPLTPAGSSRTPRSAHSAKKIEKNLINFILIYSISFSCL